MTPGAQVAITIELLDEFEGTRQPADRWLRHQFRNRRFMGSKDRRAVRAHMFDVFRKRNRLDWWIERYGLAPSNKLRVLAHSVLADFVPAALVGKAMTDGPYAPGPLSDEETGFLQSLELHSISHEEMPAWVRYDYPNWLEAFTRNADERERFEVAMAGMVNPAALDLRVNTLKATRGQAMVRLEQDGVSFHETEYSPVGLRSHQRMQLEQLSAFRDGLVEVQDEGSQLVSLMADGKPGMTVIDYCAGAGGKTLGLAAQMRGPSEGVLYACDNDPERLRRMDERLTRAGITKVEKIDLSRDSAWADRMTARADRVLVDAPCSNTGLLRRSPDAKWQLTKDDVDRLVAQQRAILEEAAGPVRPGGRLVYATCSVLPAENEHQVERFLENHRDFALLEAADVWTQAFETPWPFAEKRYLRLSPLEHRTDGFFCAVFARST